MKNYKEEALKAWKKIDSEMRQMPAFRRQTEGNLGIEHYKSVMRQIYLQTRDNPQQQAAWTLRLKGSERQMIRKILGHAIAEVGHDQLALNDIVSLGEDSLETSTYRSLPGTVAMKSFAYHASLVERTNVYLGYIYHLESMAVTSGPIWIERLKERGIPETALTFVEEHSQFDVAHMRLNEEYIAAFVRSDEDLEDFLYGAHTASVLYARMLEDAFVAADNQVTHHYRDLSETVAARKTSIEKAA